MRKSNRIIQRRERQPTPVFLPGESHGQRRLVVYSPWGCKESDTTELHTLSLSHSRFILKMLQNGLHWFPGRQMRTSEAQRGSPAPSHTAGERYLRASECGPAQGLDTVHLKCPCSAVCDPVDCSPPGPCVHGILQARILEWVAISSSRGSSQTRN